MLNKCGWLIAAISYVCATGVRAEAPFQFDQTPGLLPKSVVPVDYAFHIVPDLKTLRFSGNETIRIKVRTATREIVLNAADIDIDAATLAAKEGRPMALAPTLDKDKQVVRFTLDHPLQAGEYSLAIRYRGVINAQPQGLFFLKYPTADGTETLLATQMEATDARRLLPCWDEPAFRATFKMTVDLPRQLKAFSNMPIASSRPLAGGLRRTEFDRTPKMPSYLLALVAGKLERLTARQDGVDIGIVTAAGQRESARYALQATRDLLHYYNDYFGARYPLPKLDQIAIPGGPGFGAMENWGAIIYNDSLLLFDPRTSTEQTKQHVFEVVAHEMAHQWFGNLVTTAWWDNLWLNEGFASWMGTKATDHFNPDWHVWLKANEARETAMRLDARATTHPIQQPVRNESDAMAAFDEITYLKGQSFLRMTESWLGADRFRDGIRRYMKTHQYSNATTADLWAELERASGKQIASMAGIWTEQPGFPLVSVQTECTGAPNSTTLLQTRFQANGDRFSAESPWPIPVSLGTATATAPMRDILLADKQAALDIADCQGPLLIDPAGVGYYRARYPAAQFAALADRFRSLPEAARSKLIADTWALAGAGQVPLADYFRLIDRLGDEPRFAIWDSVAAQLQFLDRVSAGTPAQAALRQRTVALFKPMLNRLGWVPQAGESSETRQLRALAIRTLGRLGDKDVVEEARWRFETYVQSPETLPPSLADAVMRTVGRHSDAQTWATLRRLLDRSTDTEARERYLAALCSADNATLAIEALELAIDPQLAPTMTAPIPRLVATAGDHIDIAWQFVKRHGDTLLERSGSWRNRYLGRVVDNSFDPVQADELLAFARSKLAADSLSESERAADAIRVNSRLKEKLLPQLEQILSGATPGNAVWDAYAHDFLERYFADAPAFAAWAGRHEFDGRLPDWSTDGIAKSIARLHLERARAEAFVPGTLNAEQGFERELLLSQIDTDLFWLETAQWPYRSPNFYSDALDPNVYVTRAYAPLDVRLRAYTRYAAAIPAAVAQIRRNLRTPLPRSYIETGHVVFGGFVKFYQDDVPQVFKSVADAQAQQAFRTANAEAIRAMRQLDTWLTEQEATATEDFAFGREKFLQMLAQTERINIPLARLKEIADADLERNLKALNTACASYDSRLSVSNCVAKVLAHKPSEPTLAAAERQLDQLESFLKTYDLVSIPGPERAAPAESPPYMRWNAAFINVPGPYDKTLPSLYYISPPDPTWTKAEQDAYIPSEADLLFISVHEVWPGHFLQFMRAYRSPSKLAQVFADYAFAEGWAHYSEEMMWEAGLGNGDAETHVGQLLEALLRNVRLVATIGLHTGGMSVAQAETLFREKAFQDAADARQQAIRGTFDPGYGNYTLGKLMIRKLRDEWTAPRGGRASWKAFHDELLSHGSPPLPLLRNLMLGENAGPPL